MSGQPVREYVRDAEDHEIEIVGKDSTALELLNQSEIRQQIATAREFPRSLRTFQVRCREMATLNPEIAKDCTYALPRDGKFITGPSARFAEIAAASWGNCRAGARTIGEEGDFIVAQGGFHDLENNVHISFEVRRRIVNKRGERFNPDMVGVTANAACSIALRNAVLKGIPKAYWSPVWEDAKATAAGEGKSLEQSRANALAEFKKLKVDPAAVCERLGVVGIADIGIDELIALQGLLTAITDGELNVSDAFPTVAPPQRKSATASKDEAAAQETPGQPAEPAPAPKFTRKLNAAEQKLIKGIANKKGWDDEKLTNFIFDNFEIDGGVANVWLELLDPVINKMTAQKL